MISSLYGIKSNQGTLLSTGDLEDVPEATIDQKLQMLENS
jgi:hypothetical protein